MSSHTPSALELERRAYRRGRERRSVLVAIGSTLVFAAVVWVTVVNTPAVSYTHLTLPTIYSV